MGMHTCGRVRPKAVYIGTVGWCDLRSVPLEQSQTSQERVKMSSSSKDRKHRSINTLQTEKKFRLFNLLQHSREKSRNIPVSRLPKLCAINWRAWVQRCWVNYRNARHCRKPWGENVARRRNLPPNPRTLSELEGLPRRFRRALLGVRFFFHDSRDKVDDVDEPEDGVERQVNPGLKMANHNATECLFSEWVAILNTCATVPLGSSTGLSILGRHYLHKYSRC